MSFIAKLFLDNTERQILNADILIRQATDWLGRPESMPEGGQINVKIASTHETMFWDWMISPTMMKEGYIRFYKHDGMSKLTDLEFWDCYCVDYYEFFDDSSKEPLELNLTFSPGIIRFKNVVFEKNWKVTDINQTAISTYSYMDELAERSEKEEPKISEMFFSLKDGTKIKNWVDLKEIDLHIKSQNASGETISAELGHSDCQIIYNGKKLKNNKLDNISITSDEQIIPLEIDTKPKNN